MGRTEPSLGRPPAGFRRDARAKRAKATANKVIPALLSAHPRARRGVEAAELIVDPPPAAAATQEAGPMRISVRVADTLAVAHTLLSPGRRTATVAGSGSGETGPRDRRGRKQPPNRSSGAEKPGRGPDLSNRAARVAILHMASPLSPDGGFLNGSAAAAGEPSSAGVLRCTTLLPSLRDAFYRLPELGAVYTPDVLVFRGGGDGDGDDGGDDADALLPRGERWFVDCISAAMLRLPETQEVEAGGGEDESGSERGGEPPHGAPVSTRKAYASAADRELAARKMRAVLRVAQAKGVRKLVLGAWGCGAYGNPIEEVAAAWRRVLLGGRGGPRARDSTKMGADDDGENNNTKNPNNNENDTGGDGSRGGGRRSKTKSKNASGRKTRQRETWHGIEEVVFAIRSAGIAGRFAEAFGDGLVWDGEGEGQRQKAAGPHEDDDHEDRDGGEGAGSGNRRDTLYKDNMDADVAIDERDPEQRGLRELRAKIQQLELQAQQARSPQLREGLGAVLAGLRAQLPEGNGAVGGSEEGEENEEEGGENGMSSDRSDSASGARGKEDEDTDEE